MPLAKACAGMQALSGASAPAAKAGKIVNMHEAKTHLSALVDRAVQGEPFIIAKSGKPQVIVYAYVDASAPVNRLGFLPDLDLSEDSEIGMGLPKDADVAARLSEGELEPQGANACVG